MKQSLPTFNQELLKLYHLQQRKESDWGNGQIQDCLEQTRKRAYRCIDEL